MQLSVVFGAHTIKGFADEMITVSRESNVWEMVIGADGEATRVKQNDRSGSVTITLQQSSPSNDFLSAVAAGDELSNSGLFPLSIMDHLGTSLYFAGAAYIEKVPDATYGKSASDRTWVLRTDSLKAFVGGNLSSLPG